MAREVRPENRKAQRSVMHVTESSGCGLFHRQHPVMSKTLSQTCSLRGTPVVKITGLASLALLGGVQTSEDQNSFRVL